MIPSPVLRPEPGQIPHPVLPLPARLLEDGARAIRVRRTWAGSRPFALSTDKDESDNPPFSTWLSSSGSASVRNIQRPEPRVPSTQSSISSFTSLTSLLLETQANKALLADRVRLRLRAPFRFSGRAPPCLRGGLVRRGTLPGIAASIRGSDGSCRGSMYRDSSNSPRTSGGSCGLHSA